MISPRSSPDKLTSNLHHSTSSRQHDDVQKPGVRSPSPRRSLTSSKHISTSPPPLSSSSSFCASASLKSKPTLAQEIFDEFLVCKICLEAYKNPKCLECLHTFCEHCIETHVQSESTYKKYSDYREFTCPLCRKRTQLPIGGVKKLQDNFLVSNLSEMVARRRVAKFPFCDICRTVEQKFREGTAKCLDCAKMLCSSCVVAHQEIKVTSAHSIFDIEIEKDIGCIEHPEEMVRFYCEPCELCICVLCTFKEHRQHKVTQFSEAVTTYKVTMETMVDRCLEKMEKFDKHVTSLSRCEDILVSVRQKIKETATSLVEEIEKREQQLLMELDSIYGSDCIDLIEKKQDLSNQVENIRTTCKLAKTILKGKDIELLLIRKDVQDQLDCLNAVELKQLPGTVNKVVEFVTGSMDFGHLFDHDRPLLSTMVMRKTPEHPLEIGLGTEKKMAAVKGTARVESAKKKSDETSDESESSSTSGSDDSEDSSEEDDSGKGESGRKPRRDQSKTKGMGTVDRATMTDVVVLQDKAINTKARSLLNSSSGGGGSGSSGGNGGGGSSGRRPSVDQQGEEWSEQAERRHRRREKNQGMLQPTIVEMGPLQQQQQEHPPGKDVLLSGSSQVRA